MRCHVESNFPINRVLLLGVLIYSAICSNGLSTQILLTSFPEKAKTDVTFLQVEIPSQ